MRTALAILAVLATVPSIAATGIEGNWKGAISVAGREIAFAVHFTRTAGGGLRGTFDSPPQGAMGLPLTNVRFAPPRVAFMLPAGPGLAEFEGELRGDRIEGTFTQGGVPGTFRLERAGDETPPPPPSAPPDSALAGAWTGAISVIGTELGITVRLRIEGGALSGTIDIPQQGAMGLPLQNVRSEPPKVSFQLAAGPGLAEFTGERKGDRIEGAFTQTGVQGSFHVERGEPAPPAAQAPEEPVPYREEEVRFPNGPVTLAGTLTLPPSGGPFPAVVLLTGSGPQNRDEEVFGLKPFRMIADGLTRAGIAVLRYDDRGVGGSTGSPAVATSEDFATDALAAIAFLKGRPDIAPGKTGLLGHSEGGIVGSIAASRSTEVAFLVLLSGPAEKGEKILLDQAALIARAEGSDEAGIQRNAAIQRMAFEAARTDSGWDEFRAAVRKAALEEIERLKPEERQAITDPGKLADAQAEGQIQMTRNPWFRFFLGFDPATALEKVHCPVLAIFGELDLQVPAESNRKAVEEALQRGGNPDVTIRTFPKANHLYQEAKTGSPTEYATLPKKFVPGLLDLVSGWIRERTSGVAAPEAPAPEPGAPETQAAPPETPVASRPTPPLPGRGTPARAEGVARAFLRLFSKGEYAAASAAFDESVLAALPPEKLQATGEGLRAQVGAFQRVDEVRTKDEEEQTIVDLLSTFDRAPLVVRVVVNKESKISGLWFLPVSEAIPAGPQKGD